jgi:hypothetical protein
MKLHTGKILTESELKEALATVANEYRETAHIMRTSSYYADHITESDKERFLVESLKNADEIEQGLHNRNFTIWQKVDYLLTGESIPFLPN